MRFSHAYSVFLDDNGLPRIDASLEDHLSNLDKMAYAILAERQKCIAQIEARPEAQLKRLKWAVCESEVLRDPSLPPEARKILTELADLKDSN